MAKDENPVKSFQTFSKMTKAKKKQTTEPLVELPDDTKSLPGNPNIPKRTGDVHAQPMDTSAMMPNGVKEEVLIYGKVAKLPKGVKPSNGVNFLENVKVPKNSIWYIIVEKQDNELQMVKYNNKKGVELTSFVNDLKNYYITKYARNEKIINAISKISIDGDNNYSWIKNIPKISIDGKKMVTRITEDLIKILCK